MAEEQGLVTYTVLPATRAEVEVETNEALGLVEVLKGWTIETEEDAAQGAEVLKEAGSRWKALDEKRKKAVTPAVQAQREINDLFRGALQAWDEAKRRTKVLLTDRVQRIEEANRAAARAVAAGDASALGKIAPAPEQPKGLAQGNKVEIKILDFDLIPREYLCVDMSALKVAARAGKPAPPGVEFRWVKDVRSTGK